MTRATPATRIVARLSVPGLALGLALTLPSPARCQTPALTPGAEPWQQEPVASENPNQEPGRQVTLFGVIAVPNDAAIDPKLARIEPQLRKLLPGHGFRLLGVQSKRLEVNQSLTCPLGDGYAAQTTLVHPFDENGKVRLRCAVLLNQVVQLESDVSTPPNQLFFSEKQLPNGSRLLIGVGAR